MHYKPHKPLNCEETGKRRYSSQSKAMATKAYLSQKDNKKKRFDIKECYQCPYCCDWHLTSMSKERYEAYRQQSINKGNPRSN
jgi:hypothetical protein